MLPFLVSMPSGGGSPAAVMGALIGFAVVLIPLGILVLARLWWWASNCYQGTRCARKGWNAGKCVLPLGHLGDHNDGNDSFVGGDGIPEPWQVTPWKRWIARVGLRGLSSWD